MDFNKRHEELKRQFRSNWILELTHIHSRELSKLMVVAKDVSIDVIDSKTNWGYWKPETRVIGINSKLILDYPWDVTLGVFLHEIAHQVVSDIYPLAAQNETSHGPKFQLICDRMKLHPIYRQPMMDVTENGSPPSNIGPKTDKVEESPLLVKIKKLLALSGSPEPHEAEAALTKASMLMSKHNIDTASILAEADDYEIWRFPLNTKSISRKTFLIAIILRSHFFVRTITNSVYDPKTNEYFKSLDLIGRQVNLSLARHVYEYLNERSETLWERHKPIAASLGEKGLGAKTAFITNLLQSLHNKLTEAETERKSAMVKSSQAAQGDKYVIPYDFVMNDQKLENFVNMNYRNLRSSPRRTGCSYAPYSASAGRKAGEKLNIYHPIAQGQSRDGKIKGYLGKD
ncbi:MAG: DUF2786 domain-containing protein [Deltaproteobacteria bacterium]|jgi:hypothetical protein|nr:DUF2786 domain-containing protein [Deltaproteobacteria bacterium]